MELMKPKELERPRLESELQKIYEIPLMIVTAPSGYGKTTLVKRVLQKEKDLRIIWLSLGREEVDEVWIWNFLCDKFSKFNPEFGEKLRELGLPGSSLEIGHMIGIVRQFLNAPFCLVIDDYQECHSARINELLTELVYEEIGNLHIVLISRMYPDLPFEEMFLRGYCISMDQKSLALSREETDETFRINGITLSKEELDRLYEYTDGWISAVYLSLYEYKRSGRLGHFTSASHLLKTAIYDKLPASLRELCMKMSLFESFTVDEAGYVTELTVPAVTLLEAVEQYGFMQFDTGSRHFIMHTLLRTVASRELEYLQIDKKRLFNRAGEWRENNGDNVKALVYYRNSGNQDAVFRLLSGKQHNEIIETVPVIVRNIFADTPVEVKARYPVAWLSFIYDSITREDWVWGEYLFREAQSVFEQMYDLSREQVRLKGELLIIQALLEYNDIEKMSMCMREAYELLGHEPSGIFRQTLLTYGAPYMTMCYYNCPGRLKEVIAWEKEFARYHTRLVGRGEGDWDDLFDAEYAMMTGDMEKAYSLAVRAGERAVARRQSCVIVSSYYIQCRCLIYFGKVQELLQKMRELDSLAKADTSTVLVVDYELSVSYLFACLDRKEHVAGWIRSFNLEQCRRVVRNSRSGCIAYGMLLCKEKRWTELDDIADQCIAPYENLRHSYAVIRGYIYKAISAWHLDGAEKAREYLSRAFALAEQDELRIAFVENCNELMPIMEGMQGRFCNSLAPLFRQYQRSLKLFTQENKPIVLTRREQELMQLVKSGLRNGDISKSMNIALVTVEKNLTSIYRKLNVSNRAAAIARLDEISCI